ncbi:MAG: ROK family transcriptional regulator [Lacrimispora sp.]
MKLVNQQLIKNTNLKQLYNSIYRNPGISRAQLSKDSHLSKTAVSSLVDELIARKFVYDSGASGSTNVGRKPNSLLLRAEQYYVAVFCLEENRLNAALVDITGTTSFYEQLDAPSPESYLPLCREYVQNTVLQQIQKEQLLGICMVVPAMIDPDRKEIFATTLNLPGKDFVGELKRAFPDVSVALLNDTACFAYAEKVYAQVAERDFAFINFGKGIGATLFIRDEMLGRACASHTQFGHYSIDPKGKLCSCGNRGCLELMIGEDSLKERISKAGDSPALRKLPAVTYGNLGQASVYGDVVACKVMHDIAEEFSMALCNLICMVHPKLIIIGGKGKNLGPLFLQNIQDCLRTTGFRRMVDSVSVRYSLLDSDALYNGAMKYFFDIHFNFTQDMAGAFFIG